MSKKTSCPIGQKFARLKVIGEAPMVIYTSAKRVTRRSACVCLCDCGKETVVTINDLTRGKTQSCGCALITHGYARDGKVGRTYRTWVQMNSRCRNQKSKRWKDYGGRGITVCDRWLHSFENFMEDMGEKPSGLTLERIKNDLGYSKENCKWDTYKNQGRNRRSNRVFTIGGITACMIELCEHFNVKVSTVKNRIDKLGWRPEDSFEPPSRPKP